MELKKLPYIFLCVQSLQSLDSSILNRGRQNLFLIFTVYTLNVNNNLQS